MKALGAYLYAGGFAAGVRQAGFDVVAHLEGDDAYGVSSARLNWPEMPIHHGPARWPLGDLRNIDIDFAFANPPCALFSSQGIVTTRGPDSWRADPRLQHWWDSFRLLEELQPRAFALESVTQAYSRGRPLIDEMTKRALVRGYSVSHILLDAKWTGIPQSRRRFFIVAHRPAALIGYQHNWAPPPSVVEVLAEISEPGWAQELPAPLMNLLAQTEAGGLLCDTWMRITEDPERFRTPRGLIGRPSFRHKRLPLTGLMGAFVSADNYHPTEVRPTGINEWKALCGYPADFRLAPPERGWAHLLARAVMPPVGAWLGRAIAATLAQPDAAWADRRVTLIDVREPGRDPVDLTSGYLDDGGRVRLRARTDGTLDWGSGAAPQARAERGSGVNRPDRTPAPARVPLAPEVIVSAPTPERPSVALTEGVPRAAPGEGSGKFIKRLWRETELTPDEIVAAVHGSFTGRTTARGDVYYNVRKMVDAGEAVRPWSGSSSKPKRASPGAGAEPVPSSFSARAAQTTSPVTPELAAGRTAGSIPAAGATIVGRELRRIAVVDWFPRVCGATDSGPHLAEGDDRYELVTASLSGRPLAAWRTPWAWRTLPLREAAARLNAEYDAVLLTDIACLAPEMTDRNELPLYARELGKITIPTTAIFHGGMTYKPVYDPVIDALVGSPGFTGSILTAREGQARERLARWSVRCVVNPFYAYRLDRSPPAPTAHRRAVMMTQRLASNKGQNALLAMMNHLNHDADVWGYNSFGLPSIGWRLHELGSALGYVPDGEPALRRDMAALTHPNAPRFYTGAFAFTAPNGRRYAYKDGYSRLDEVDWSPWVHLSMFSPDFHGLLEFAILDAIHAGAIAVVPEGTVPRGWYDDSLITIPFDGSTLWAKKDMTTVSGRDFDRAGCARVINELLAYPDEELKRIAARQLAAVRARHAPAEFRKSVEAALRGEGT